MTFEDGSVGGNFTYDGMYTCWMGLFRAHIGGSVYVLNNRTNTTVPGIAYDSPGIATNTINGKLICTGNKPKPEHRQEGQVRPVQAPVAAPAA